MPDRLPPLNALRAFEAAARHLSFARAADELAVTPAALSFQIKNLEEHLGAPLFRRLNRAVELTEAGRVLLPDATEGFEALRRGWRGARRLQDSSTLVVTAGPAFTAKWLAPRLYNFAAAHPEIELRFVATLRMMDFDREEVDISIRYGLGQDEDLFSEPLYDGFLTPMMRPDVAERVKEPADLMKETLIHDDSLRFLPVVPNWERWLKAAGVAHGVLKGPRFSQADHALDLALEGAGVVLGRSSISLNLLRTGALVAPFRLALTTDAMFRLVCPKGQETRPAIRQFREWIHGEVAKDKPLAEGLDFVPAASIR
ncbi:transcriptional regulator GcvA [Algicella marina]|uniref:Transcriptional regulator GcvA n=1 Tax=Algicella marina TaxID=2683284 RepID=A0A6P1T4T8_9RHOB|nr:transcriptional regulator GcvA [Algicella marina]QHQ37027.1 transcriptional regulator GcvA [Algicella marina]